MATEAVIDRSVLWEGVTDDAYHRDVSHDSSSTVRLYDADSRAYYDRLLGAGEPRRAESQAQSIGKVYHAMLEGAFDEKYVVLPPSPRIDLRTKAGKLAQEERRVELLQITQNSNGRSVVNFDDVGLATQMFATTMAHRQARCLVEANGTSEVSVRWRDDEWGLNLKVRFDRLLNDGTILEYKTADVSGAYAHLDFRKECKKWRYDIQAALYCRARKRLLGIDGDFYYVVATKDGLGCMVIKASQAYLNDGLAKLSGICRRLAVAHEAERFHPGEHNWIPHCYREIIEL